MSGLLTRPMPLALMNSADRRPNQFIAHNRAWPPWVWSIPGPAGSSSRQTILTYPHHPMVEGDVDPGYAATGAA